MALKQRILWLDNLKGILIILVVFGHCIQHVIPNYSDNILFRYIYSFHMMLFMFASGYSCYRAEIRVSILRKRAIQLLIPFFVWSLLMCLIRSSFQLYDMILYPDKSFWFLWVLFFITFFHVCAFHVSKKLRLKEELTVILVGFFLLAFSAIFRTNIFSINLIAFHFFFYTFGFYAHKYYLIDRIPRSFSEFACFLWLVLAWFWGPGKPIQQIDYRNPFLTIIVHYVVALIAIFAFVPLINRQLNYKTFFLYKIGQGTLAIYVIHLSLLSLSFSLNTNELEFLLPSWLYVFLLTILVTAISYSLYRLLLIFKTTSFFLLGKANFSITSNK